MWVGSVVSPFQLIHKPLLRAILELWNSPKKFLHNSNMKNFFPWKLFANRSMGGSPGESSEELVMKEKRKKGWGMICDVGEAMEGLENEL